MLRAIGRTSARSFLPRRDEGVIIHTRGVLQWVMWEQGWTGLPGEYPGEYMQGILGRLARANLSGANLRHANLQYANLQGAFLQEANVRGLTPSQRAASRADNSLSCASVVGMVRDESCLRCGIATSQGLDQTDVKRDTLSLVGLVYT
jgi:hypothetical protein